MPSSKRCIATTKKGKRCKNRSKAESGYLCLLHKKALARLEDTSLANRPSDRLEKVGRGIKIAGGTIGVISGIVKLIELIIKHWDRITTVWEYNIHTPGMSSREDDFEDRGVIVSGRVLIRKYQSLLDRDSISDSDLQAVSVSFDEWIDSLPVMLRKDITDSLNSPIEEARLALANISQ